MRIQQQIIMQFYLFANHQVSKPLVGQCILGFRDQRHRNAAEKLLRHQIRTAGIK